jgi:hypothetical protein
MISQFIPIDRQKVRNVRAASISGGGAYPRLGRARSVRFLPALERMEERTLLSTFIVTNNHDSGTGSLRAAIHAAASGDSIAFSHSLDDSTIALFSGELAINKSLQIQGPGAGRLAVSARGASRVFDITTSGVNVTISGLTIRDGLAAQGAGILDQGGSLTLQDDVIEHNQALGVNPGDSAEGGGSLSRSTPPARQARLPFRTASSPTTWLKAQRACPIPTTRIPI